MAMTIERIRFILENCRLFDKVVSKPAKNEKQFWKRAKQYGWITDVNIDQKKAEVIKLLERIGFKEEVGLAITWKGFWYYHEESDTTIKVEIGVRYNDYYKAASGFMNTCYMEGKTEHHTRRIGESWMEDGQWKTLTRHGVYTGD